ESSRTLRLNDRPPRAGLCSLLLRAGEMVTKEGTARNPSGGGTAVESSLRRPSPSCARRWKPPVAIDFDGEHTPKDRARIAVEASSPKILNSRTIPQTAIRVRTKSE